MAKSSDTTNPSSERKCSVEGCGRAGKITKGLCLKHYMRVRRHGDPLHAARAEPGGLLRWLHEHASYDGDECIRWPYAHNSHGYAAAVNYKGRRRAASRVMCIFVRGEPPFEGAEAAHSCGKGHLGCLNPKHLRWATSGENTADQLVHGTLICGEKHMAAKLKDKDARLIKRDERLQADIAREYGISPSLVSRIKAGQKWRHIK